MRSPTSALPSAAVLPLLFAACAALSGCGSDKGGGSSGGGSTTTDTTTDTNAGGTAGAGGATGGGGAGGATQPEPQFIKTMSGDATWQVTFDDTAKAAGATDCSYTRHYEAREDRSAPWLCPSCEIMFLADVTLTDGLDTCYKQVSMSAPFEQEWLGYGNGQWWRSPVGPMSQQGTATVDATTVTTANMVPDLDAAVGGKMAFTVSGSLTFGQMEGDPMNGYVPPKTYACGWPKADPPPYAGDYVLAKNAILPDGVFHDKCEETVRIHDFKGTYLVVDMSALDCPPCQQMGKEEEAFINDMKAKGIDVNVITLMAPALDDVFGVTTTSKLNTWTTKYNLTTPVLNDRAWGISIFEPAIGAANIGYPSWVVVRPDLTVIDFQTGYGSWSDMATIIETDSKP